MQNVTRNFIKTILRQLYIIILVIFISIDSFGQSEENLKRLDSPNSIDTTAKGSSSELFHRRDLLFQIGLGIKSHLGNWGLSTNLFLSKNFSLKISVGGGQFNYNGLLFSLGSEYIRNLNKNKFIMLGSVWTATGGTYGVIDDESPTRREYSTQSSQYLRTYTGIAFNTSRGVFKIEIGYSYAFYAPKYTLYGVWTPVQIEQVKKAMDSGLLVSFSAGGILTNLQRKRK